MGYSLGPNGERLYNGRLDRRSEQRRSGFEREQPRRTSHSSLIIGIVLIILLLGFGFVYFYSNIDESPQVNGINSDMNQGSVFEQEIEDDIEISDTVSITAEAGSNQESTVDDIVIIDGRGSESPKSVSDNPIDEMDAEYEMPGSDSYYLSESDIAGYDRDGIQLIVNEIYARHGRVFERAENDTYFRSKSWYHPVEGKSDEQIVSEFNSYEKANVEFLATYLN